MRLWSVNYQHNYVFIDVSNIGNLVFYFLFHKLNIYFYFLILNVPMNFTFNGYGLVLLFFGTLIALLAIYIYRRGTSIVRWFSLMMASNAIWSIMYGLI